MEDEEDNNFLEGFLCPICKVDLLSSEQLLAHFDQEHAEQDFYKTLLKDLFGKAKKKLLKEDRSSSVGNGSTNGSTLFRYAPNDCIGYCCSKTKDFIKARGERMERLSVPTNQLIIRLNKLLNSVPTASTNPKNWEQTVVTWMDGTTVNRCPDCAEIFNITRRKHHCRTCGGIMCNKCSRFMSITIACKILDRDPLRDNFDLRVCRHCMSLLERRETKRNLLKDETDIIYKIYDILLESITECKEHIRTYITMYKSLDSGENKYSLKDAQLLRIRLLKLAESIDNIADKFKSMSEKTEGIEAKLCSGVRQAAISFLSTTVQALPHLPTQEEIDNKRKSVDSVAKRVVQEKRPEASVGEGWVWVPTERSESHTQEDPLLLQMNNIRAYIKQARLANRTDEVASLEQNLQELKKEYWELNKQEH